jgi:hypothetical protein
MTPGGPNPFVDRRQLPKTMAIMRERFDADLAKQQAAAPQ